MEIEKQLQKIIDDLLDTNMLLEVMLGALRYFETENGQGCEIIYLGELIEEKIKNILNYNDEIIYWI